MQRRCVSAVPSWQKQIAGAESGSSAAFCRRMTAKMCSKRSQRFTCRSVAKVKGCRRRSRLPKRAAECLPGAAQLAISPTLDAICLKETDFKSAQSNWRRVSHYNHETCRRFDVVRSSNGVGCGVKQNRTHPACGCAARKPSNDRLASACVR